MPQPPPHFTLMFFFNSFAWTMRILGFIIIFALIFPNVLLARRLPPKRVSGGLFNLKDFKSAAFSAYCASSLVAFLGLYTGAFDFMLQMNRFVLMMFNGLVLTYIDISAASIGIDDNFSFYLVSIANGASACGRLTSGLLCDRVGKIFLLARCL